MVSATFPAPPAAPPGADILAGMFVWLGLVLLEGPVVMEGWFRDVMSARFACVMRRKRSRFVDRLGVQESKGRVAPETGKRPQN